MRSDRAPRTTWRPRPEEQPNFSQARATWVHQVWDSACRRRRHLDRAARQHLRNAVPCAL